MLRFVVWVLVLMPLGAGADETPDGPLSQVATVQPARGEAFFDRRRGRIPALRVRGDIVDGAQAPEVTRAILPMLALIRAALPFGYAIKTAGASEGGRQGQASVNAVMPLMVLVMLSLLMLQMQSFSRVAMVILTAPLGLIGVSAALPVTGAQFGFVAMLEFIALDQIERDRAQGSHAALATAGAVVRRTRPIPADGGDADTGLTAVTPILG